MTKSEKYKYISIKVEYHTKTNIVHIAKYLPLN